MSSASSAAILERGSDDEDAGLLFFFFFFLDFSSCSLLEAFALGLLPNSPSASNVSCQATLEVARSCSFAWRSSANSRASSSDRILASSSALCFAFALLLDSCSSLLLDSSKLANEGARSWDGRLSSEIARFPPSGGNSSLIRLPVPVNGTNSWDSRRGSPKSITFSVLCCGMAKRSIIPAPMKLPMIADAIPIATGFNSK
mmetsp:Transcript_20688/g.33432  ORF Transcript_20688/g.33432 Transcript_20688/m.33432 type:complete len:201 (-) Transcript_20688:303-905(-)